DGTNEDETEGEAGDGAEEADEQEGQQDEQQTDGGMTPTTASDVIETIEEAAGDTPFQALPRSPRRATQMPLQSSMDSLDESGIGVAIGPMVTETLVPSPILLPTVTPTPTPSATPTATAMPYAPA